MKRLILTSILTLISAFAFAAAVTVNGISCGSLKSLTLSGTGDYTVSTDGTCGAVSPPVEPPASTCPPGAKCIKRTWPINPQETITLDGTSVLAIEVTSGASGAGKLMTAYTAGNSGNRQIAISSKPGDFAVSAPCIKSGTQSTTTYWGIGVANQSQCLMVPNQTYWVNLRHTNCAGRCEFILLGY